MYLLFLIIHCSFSSRSSKHHYTQTKRTRALKFLENVHPPLHVTCHVSLFFFCFFSSFFGRIGRAYRWRKCYQQGLLCLVFIANAMHNANNCNHVVSISFLTLVGQKPESFLMLGSLDFWCNQKFMHWLLWSPNPNISHFCVCF